MAKKKNNKTLSILKDLMEQHSFHLELWDSCELPAWAVSILEKEVDRLEKMEEKNG